MKEQNKTGIWCMAALLAGFSLSAWTLKGMHEKNGASSYRAQLDADCRLVGFHRIGEKVYLCKDTKAAAEEIAAQQNRTVLGETE